MDVFDGKKYKSGKNHRVQWSLMIDFTPGAAEQRWSLSAAPIDLTNGTGDARVMAHSICVIINGLGGRKSR